jgi:hypothetical protein
MPRLTQFPFGVEDQEVGAEEDGVEVFQADQLDLVDGLDQAAGGAVDPEVATEELVVLRVELIPAVTNCQCGELS